MNPPRLELRRASKIYQTNGEKLEALHEVSLALEPGTITALVGRSGCGKTTLLNLAGAMDFPTSGRSAHRRPLHQLAPRRRADRAPPRTHRFCFSVFSTAAGAHGARERRAAAAARRCRARARNGARTSGMGGTRREGEFVPVPTFGRADATRGHRARAGACAGDSHRRRAHGQSRQRERRPGARIAPRCGRALSARRFYWPLTARKPRPSRRLACRCATGASAIGIGTGRKSACGGFSFSER